MGVLDASSGPTLLDVKSWMPFATFTDAERMAEAALAAKTLVAEARRVQLWRFPRQPGAVSPESPDAPLCRARPQTRLKEATEATRLAADVRARAFRTALQGSARRRRRCSGHGSAQRLSTPPALDAPPDAHRPLCSPSQVLRTSREEVQGLKVVVQTLKNTSVTGASEEAARELEDERAKVREAQLHVHGLTQSFDALLSEMERLKQDTVAAVGTGNDSVRAPELLRPTSALGGPEPSFAVAVARVVLQGYSTQQAEGALREIGRNDAAAAVGHLRAQGARPEIDPPTAARLGFASRIDSPYPTGDVIFPKGRPHVAAGAAAWPGQVKPRPWRGDLFVARRRAADLLVTLTSAAFSTACDTEDRAREACLGALTAQKVLANRPVPARLLINAGSLEHTAYALSAHRRDPDIVCSAAAVLRELTANHGSAALCVQHPNDLASATVAACAALKSNPGNIGVGIHCAALLWGLCTLGGAPVQNAAVRGGVQQYLLELLTCYPEHRELVWRITGSLLAMAVRNGDTQEALTAWGVQSAVRNALARDPTLTYGGEFSELRPWMKISGPTGPPPVDTQEPELAKPGRQGRDGNPRGRRGGPSAPPAPPAKLLSRGAMHGSAAWPSVAGGDDDYDDEDYDEDEDADFVAVQTHRGGMVVPPFKPGGGMGASSHVSSAARQGGITAPPPAYLTRNTAADEASDARIMVASAHPAAAAAPPSVAAARSVARSAVAGSDAHSDGLTAQLAATAPMRYVYAPGPAAPHQSSEAHDAATQAELAAVQRLLNQGPHGHAPGGAARSDVSRGSRHQHGAKAGSSAASGVSSRQGAGRDGAAADTTDSYDEEYDEEESEMEPSVVMEQQQQPAFAAPVPPAMASQRPSQAASLGTPSAPSSVSAPPRADPRLAEAAATRERLRAEQAAAVEAAARAQAEEEHDRLVAESQRRRQQQDDEEAQLAAETERRRQAEEARRAAREAHLRSVIEAERKAIEAEERAAALERAAEAQARAAEAEERAAAAMAIDAERRERRAAAAAAMATAQERAARATAAVNTERQRAAQLAAAAAEKAESDEARARDEAARAEEKRRIAAEQAAEARARAMARAEEAAIRERQRQAAASARAAAAAVEKAQGVTTPEAVLQPAEPVYQKEPEQAPAAGVPMPEEGPARSGEAVDRALGLLALPSASPESVSSSLRTLTAACGTGKAAYVVASGGMSLVVGAMRRYGDNPAVCADACLVLGVVTHESDAAQGALAQSPCSDGEAVSAVCAALFAFPKVAALQATAAWALWGIVRGSASNAKRAVVSKAPTALVAAISNHAESAEVGQSASGALLAIAAASDVGQEAVANARGVSAVKSAMKRHASIKFRGEFDSLREWLKNEGKRG